MKQQAADTYNPDNNAENPRTEFIEGGRGWPINFALLRKPPTWFSGIICAIAFTTIIVLLFASLIAIARIAISITAGSASEAFDASKALLPVAAAAIGLPLIIWRLMILARQNRIAEEKGQIDRETQYTTIFSKSVEQLGSTREIKERADQGSKETISKTVPNIEMRLGGIHSLSRLSAESKKDAPKIEKMLISYVKENSWHDTNGSSLTKPPPARLPNPENWSYVLGRSSIEARGGDYSAYSEWSIQYKSELHSMEIWAKSVPEARSDVSEIIFGFPDLPRQQDEEGLRSYRDSIFADIAFSPQMLKGVAFKRCSFVRCKFDFSDLHTIRFAECAFVFCEFWGKASMLEFRNSRIFKSDLSYLVGSNLTFCFCLLADSDFRHSNSLSLLLESCVTVNLYIRHSRNLRLQMDDASNINFKIRSCVLADGSALDNACFVASEFRAADISALQLGDIAVFNNSFADKRTTHPGHERPSHWEPARI